MNLSPLLLPQAWPSEVRLVHHERCRRHQGAGLTCALGSEMVAAWQNERRPRVTEISGPTEFSVGGSSITFNPDPGQIGFNIPRPATPYAHPQFSPIAGYAPVTVQGAWTPAALYAARLRAAQRQLSVANHPPLHAPRHHYVANFFLTQLREIINVILDHGTDAAPIAPVAFVGQWLGFGTPSRLASPNAKRKRRRRTLRERLRVLHVKLTALKMLRRAEREGPQQFGPDWKQKMVVWRAESQLGADYSSGGGNASGPTLGTEKKSTDTVGFDCSHLIAYAYAGVGVDLRNAAGDASTDVLITRGTSVDRTQMRAGDLVFTNAPDPNTGKPELHVVMCIGNGQVISAPHTGANVRIEPLSAYTGAGSYFKDARRIIN